jgi:PAS domain S-box-containing protein
MSGIYLKKHSIKINILISLIIALIAVFLVFILDIYQSRQKDIELELKSTMNTVNNVLELEIENDAIMLMAVIETLSENRKLKLAFRERDRKKLLALTESLFEKLRSNHRVTHFYFTDPQRINFLRVHKPEKYGDLLDRHTLISAERTGKTSYGVEMGPLGTLTLRVVQPYYDEKGLIGYLELGEEIDHLIPKIREITGAEIYISIKKKYLVREKWEEGMKMLGRSPDWNMFSDDVIIAQTVSMIPHTVSSYFSGETHKHDMIHMASSLTNDERSFRSMLSPLIDAGGTEIGDIVVMLDITKWLASAKDSLLRDSMFFLAICSILFTVLYLYISKVENYIVDINDELSDDIRKLKQAEVEIAQSEERFRTLAEQSPVSIQIMNPEGWTIQVNKAWEKLWGLTLDDLDGYNILKDRQLEELGVISYLEKAFSGEAVFIPAAEYDAHKTLGIGTIRWVQAHAYPVKNEGGDIRIVVLMHEDISERKQAEEKIKATLKEKEILMKEIYHRVKNNMSVVSSLLRLQSSKVGDERYRAMFDDSASRIKTMAAVHEKLYQSENLTEIIFSDYIRDMVNNIYESYGQSSRIKLITDIEAITLEVKASIPCGLIVNELITNSMKYAFPEGRVGEIMVSLHENDKDEIELTVGDNGVGMPEELDFRNTDSLGLSLVNALVEQLQGEVELIREKGTRYKITFRKT